MAFNFKKFKDMRRLITTLLLSLFLVSGNILFADRHDNRKGHDRGRTERRFDRKDHRDKRHDSHHDRRNDKKNDFRAPKYNHKPKAHKAHYRRPVPDRELRRMVAYAARGGRDIRVWRIDENTFIVKYLLGGRYYTQRIYPFSGRYGSRGVVNINWNPLSSWTLLPSINITLPIN